MRHHGFADFPDPHPAIGTDGKPGAALPVPGDINQNSSQYLAAEHACRPLLPGGANASTPLTPAQRRRS